MESSHPESGDSVQGSRDMPMVMANGPRAQDCGQRLLSSPSKQGLAQQAEPPKSGNFQNPATLPGGCTKLLMGTPLWSLGLEPESWGGPG